MKVASERAVLMAGLNSADGNISSSRIIFHLTNKSDDAVTFLIWNTPFERVLSADVFTVELDGVPVAYQGRKVKRSAPGDQEYMSVPAREHVEMVVDMAAYYDMSAAGEYRVSFTPSLMHGQAHLNEQTPVSIEEGTITIRVAPQ